MKVDINAKSIKQVINAETVNIDQRINQSKPDDSESVTSLSKMPNSIFISYRRKDSADVVGRLYDCLANHFGKSAIFKDVYSIPLGSDFKEFLTKAVGNCNVLIAVIGDRWLEKDTLTGKSRLEDPQDFVRAEIEIALTREIPIIPLLVRDISFPSEKDLPVSLNRLTFKNGQRLRPDPDFHHDIDLLIKGLENILNR